MVGIVRHSIRALDSLGTLTPALSLRERGIIGGRGIDFRSFAEAEFA